MAEAAPAMPAIVAYLTMLVESLHLPKEWKRLRIAVTNDEYDQIKGYMLTRGDFYRRIRGVLLVVDGDPESKEFWDKMSYRLVDARNYDE